MDETTLQMLMEAEFWIQNYPSLTQIEGKVPSPLLAFIMQNVKAQVDDSELMTALENTNEMTKDLLFHMINKERITPVDVTIFEFGFDPEVPEILKAIFGTIQIT